VANNAGPLQSGLHLRTAMPARSHLARRSTSPALTLLSGGSRATRDRAGRGPRSHGVAVTRRGRDKFRGSISNLDWIADGNAEHPVCAPLVDGDFD